MILEVPFLVVFYKYRGWLLEIGDVINAKNYHIFSVFDNVVGIIYLTK